MSDKTPRDGFGDMDLEREGFDFPGAEPDDLTEEERSFTFDEDYLDRDDPVGAHEADPVDALASAFRTEQEREKKVKQDRADKVDALAAAFRKQGSKSAPADKSGEDREEAVFSAASKPPRKEEAPASDPATAAEGTDPVPGTAGKKGLSPWRRRQKEKRMAELREADPITVGRELRADQMLVYDSELDEIDYTDEEDLPEMRDYMPIRFRRYGRIGIGGGILYALFVISVSIILACVAWLCASDVLALNKEPKSAIVTIDEYAPEGDEPAVTVIDDKEVAIKVDIDQVADELKNAGMIEYKWLFKLFSRFSHAETKIDPGTYDVSTELDYRALVTALQFGSGNQEITRITFPEGYSLEQIFTLLEDNHIAHKSELYEAAANYDFDYDFLADLPLGDASRLEGYLFPDTYDFYEGEDASVAINRFLRNMNNKLTEDVRSAAANRGLSVRELLTLASLIEKEAGSDDERGIMASIIYNRLNAGWLLQLDSTLNYIKGTSTFALTNEDMEIDDPYNTYKYEGLPPGPICNPGLASIQAALEPEDTNYWYWYSVDGVSTFFTEYDDFINFQNANPVSD